MALLAAAMILVPSYAVLAHSGGLDQQGGHHDRKRGGYHYHQRRSSNASVSAPSVGKGLASMPARRDNRDVQRGDLHLQELQMINALVDMVVDDKLQIIALEERIEALEREIATVTRNMSRREHSHDYAKKWHSH